MSDEFPTGIICIHSTHWKIDRLCIDWQADAPQAEQLTSCLVSMLTGSLLTGVMILMSVELLFGFLTESLCTYCYRVSHCSTCIWPLECTTSPLRALKSPFRDELFHEWIWVSKHFDWCLDHLTISGWVCTVSCSVPFTLRVEINCKTARTHTHTDRQSIVVCQWSFMMVEQIQFDVFNSKTEWEWKRKYKRVKVL